jgi:hypothetical protein
VIESENAKKRYFANIGKTLMQVQRLQKDVIPSKSSNGSGLMELVTQGKNHNFRKNYGHFSENFEIEFLQYF